MGRARRAVTVVEVLMVLVILAILAAIAYPRFTGNPTRRAIYDVRATLERLKDAQDTYFRANRQYTADLKALGFTTSPDVAVTISGEGLPSAAGWSASAATTSAPIVHCYVGVGADTVIGTVHMQNGAVVCP